MITAVSAISNVAFSSTDPRLPLMVFFATLLVGLVGYVTGIARGKREALDLNTTTLGQWLYEHTDPNRATTAWATVPQDLQESYAAVAGDLLDELESVR